jgi:hypothetical protein
MSLGGCEIAGMIEKLGRLTGSSWVVGVGLSVAIAVTLLVAVFEGPVEYDLNRFTRPVAAVLAGVTFPIAMLSALVALPVANRYNVNVAFIVGFGVWTVLALPYGIALDYLVRAIHRRSRAFMPAALAGGLAGFLFVTVLTSGARYPGTGTSGLLGAFVFMFVAGCLAVMAVIGVVMSIVRSTRHHGLPILAAAGGALLAMFVAFN